MRAHCLLTRLEISTGKTHRPNIRTRRRKGINSTKINMDPPPILLWNSLRRRAQAATRWVSVVAFTNWFEAEKIH